MGSWGITQRHGSEGIERMLVGVLAMIGVIIVICESDVPAKAVPERASDARVARVMVRTDMPLPLGYPSAASAPDDQEPTPSGQQGP
jgi:hypothetical protein